MPQHDKMSAAAEDPQSCTKTKRSWSGRRTTFERQLLCLLAIVFAIAVAMIVIVVATSVRQKPPCLSCGSPKKCFTQDCVLAAAEMLEIMNTSVDPCDDFYEYACGKWNTKNAIPSNKDAYSVLSKINDDVYGKLKVLLESAIDEKEPAFLTKPKKMYKSCMNLSQLNKRDVTPLLLLLSQLGDWPVLTPSWNESRYDVIELVAKINMVLSQALWMMGVILDLQNSDRHIVVFNQASLIMSSRDYYLDPKYSGRLDWYRNFTIEVAITLGADRNVSVTDMKDMVDFEVNLANITVPPELRKSVHDLYHVYTVDELSNNVTDAIEWQRLLNLTFGEVNITLNGSSKIAVYGPDFFQPLADLLENTPKRTVVNYILWNVVYSSMSLLSENVFADITQLYKLPQYGITTPKLRWMTCIGSTSSLFGMAVGRLFVDKYFDKTAKLAADEMITDLKEAFISMLAEAAWMDENTRNLAIAKANAIEEEIGYPEFIKDDDSLDRKYKELHPHEETYFENNINSRNDAAKKTMMKINDRVNKFEWDTNPATVNAYYNVLKNTIIFPAGILQPPIYSKYYPRSVNYGGIGMVIGHEITHGFDNIGRQFDMNGNVNEWWPKEVIEKFTERTECITNQYDNYTLPEGNLKINGKLTLNENIADNGGLKESFRAYRNWAKRQVRDEDVLPGLNMDNNQLFFLSFAQVWCNNARLEAYKMQMNMDTHSPGRFRVIGSLSNSEDFARAFKCPAGSKMNPSKKCAVW